MSVFDAVEIYVKICNIVGSRPVMNHMKVIEYVSKQTEPIAVVDLIKTLHIDRAQTYDICGYLETMGFLQLIDEGFRKGKLPEEIEEWWGLRAKERLAKRLGIRKPKSYLFTPWNAVKGIDERIKELQEVKEWLKSLKPNGVEEE